MRMKRRLTAILLCLCMALTLLPATAFAADEPVLTYDGRSDGIRSGYLSVSVDGEDKGFLWPEESLAISAGSQVKIELKGAFIEALFDGWAVEGIDPAQIPDAK